MARLKEKRTVRDSKNKVIITKAPIARGHVSYDGKFKFIAKSSVKKPVKERPNELERIIHIIEYNKKDYSYFQEFYGNDRTIDVLLKYKDKKSKEGKYGNPEDNLPIEIITLSGKQLYKKV